jgi:hypothetical protein
MLTLCWIISGSYFGIIDSNQTSPESMIVIVSKSIYTGPVLNFWRWFKDNVRLRGRKMLQGRNRRWRIFVVCKYDWEVKSR